MMRTSVRMSIKNVGIWTASSFSGRQAENEETAVTVSMVGRGNSVRYTSLMNHESGAWK